MKVITNYRKACEEVAKVFVRKYYPSERDGRYCFWVGDEVGGVFSVGDRFYNVDRMIEALELKATYEQLSDYDDAELDAALKEPPENLKVNFRNYVKYGWINKNEN